MNQFLCNWSTSGLPEGKSDRFCTRMSDFINQLDDAFNREQCAFYDVRSFFLVSNILLKFNFQPEVKNGGPNPDVEIHGMVIRKNKNAKGRSAYRPRLVNGEHQRRRRRNADDEDCENLSEAECDRLALRDLEICNAEDKANRK